MTISFTSNGTTSQILHNGTVVHEINAGGLQNLGVSNLATEAKPLGAGQTWQNFTIGTDRVSGTTYTNSTGRPIMVAVAQSSAAGSVTITAEVNGVVIHAQVSTNSNRASTFFVVPTGAEYKVTGSGSALLIWSELR